MTITLTSFSKESLLIFLKFLKNYDNNHFQLTILRLPTQLKKFCVLKSPHINKKAKVHFELKTHKALINFNIYNVYNLKKLFYILFNKPKSIHITIKFYKHKEE